MLQSSAPHEHGTLPDLIWTTDDNRADISCDVAEAAERWCWWACSSVTEWDEALLFQIETFDFRNIRMDDPFNVWCHFVNTLWEAVSRITNHSGPSSRILDDHIGFFQWRHTYRTPNKSRPSAASEHEICDRARPE